MAHDRSRRIRLTPPRAARAAAAWASARWRSPACWRERRLAGAAPTARPTRWPRSRRTSRRKAKRVIHLFLNGGPSHVDTFDPKPLLAKYAGQPLPTATSRTERKTGAALPVAVQVHASTARAASRSASSSPHVAEHVDDIVRHPLDARRRAEPRAVADADELRRRAADPAEHRARGSPTAWAPRTRTCPASSRCAPAAIRSRRRRTGSPASCPASTRARTSTRSTPTIEQADREHPQRPRSPPRAARSSSTCSSELNRRAPAARARTTPRSRPASSRSSSAYRMQIEAAEAFDVSREPQHIRDMYGPGVQARQTADRPPAGRARRALRAGLARRRPAVGQPRRHRSQPPQARRRDATSRSPRCSPT